MESLREADLQFDEKDNCVHRQYFRERKEMSPIEVTATAITAAYTTHIQEARQGSTVSLPSSADEIGKEDNHQHAKGQPPNSKPIQPSGAECGEPSFGIIQTGMKEIIAGLAEKKSTLSAVRKPDEWHEIELCVDSGACITVMPKSWCSGISIVESPAQRAGVEYEVANGQAILNLGQRQCEVMTIGSMVAKRMTFQVAEVHKPLLSVSACSDLGFDCQLGKFGGALVNRQSGEVIPLERRDNLYVMRAWVRQDPGHSVESFQGPESCRLIAARRP